MANPSKNLHILIFPLPAQGHMLPLLDLTHQLALHNLAITIIITPKNLPILTPLLTLHPSIHTQIFQFPDHPSIPHGVENVKDIGNHGLCPMVSALSKLKEPVIQWFNKSRPDDPPDALISDFFLGWTQDLANQIGIPRIAFYSSGPLLASVLHHVWRNPEAFIELDVVGFSDLPRSPSFVHDHLPSVFLRYRESEPDWQIFKEGIVANYSSWGSVFNTIDALEDDYLDYLKKVMGHGHVYAVGPLNLMGLPDRTVHEDPIIKRGIMQWLDQRQDDSVLYVCFGSQKLLKKAQVDALATGLESSGIHFVWVVRSLTAHEVSDGYGTIPDGFEERVSGRGLVVKGWAPQVQILGHRAVGRFLSHCGWNSVLEAIVAGVMILAWPMEADQFVNARLLVDFLGAGFCVIEGSDTVPDSAWLAKVIDESMGKETMQKLKTKELQNKALEAIGSRGSSMRDIHGLVKQLAQLQART